MPAQARPDGPAGAQAIFVVPDDANFLISNGNILVGDGGIDLDSVVIFSDKHDTNAHFSFDNTVINGVAFWSIGASGPATTGGEIAINNGQGCTQLIADKITLNDVRFGRCGPGFGPPPGGQYENKATAMGDTGLPSQPTVMDMDPSHYTSPDTPECKVEMVTHVSHENVRSETEIKSDQSWGQTFSHTSGGGTYRAGQIDLQLRSESDARRQDITVSLRGTWNGPDLGSAVIASADLGPEMAWHSLDIGDVVLNDGQTYFIRIATDTSFGKVYAGYDGDSSFSPGDMIDKDGDDDDGKDLAFRVEGEDDDCDVD